MHYCVLRNTTVFKSQRVASRAAMFTLFFCFSISCQFLSAPPPTFHDCPLCHPIATCDTVLHIVSPYFIISRISRTLQLSSPILDFGKLTQACTSLRTWDLAVLIENIGDAGKCYLLLICHFVFLPGTPYCPSLLTSPASFLDCRFLEAQYYPVYFFPSRTQQRIQTAVGDL